MQLARLLAISDLHIDYPENRSFVERLRPSSRGDWLLVGGDVSQSIEDVEWALRTLANRFARVVWTPGNHELWSFPRDELRGMERYAALVAAARRAGALTPEDPYPVWEGDGGPATVAPLFILYDYSFGRNLAPTNEEALRLAERAGVVCSDEYLLHPDPFPSREAWCEARVEHTQWRLEQRETGIPTVLLNHFPLTVDPIRLLRHQEFAQWCGTERTSDWHHRFDAAVVIYGHLHIPLTTYRDGVRFEDVSLAYPAERSRPHWPHNVPRQILPAPDPA